MRFLVLFAFLVFGSTALSTEIPSACRSCMSACPHLTKDMKPCDTGCPDVCSKAQAAAYKKEQAAQDKNEKCFECMSSCPHLTRDFKPCDGGCPDVCDKEGLRWAFLKANKKAQKCQDNAKDSGAGAVSR